MTLPSIGVPLLLWYSSKRKDDTPKTKKNWMGLPQPSLPKKSRCFPDSKGNLKCSVFSFSPWPSSPGSCPALTRAKDQAWESVSASLVPSWSRTNRIAFGSRRDLGALCCSTEVPGVCCWRCELSGVQERAFWRLPDTTPSPTTPLKRGWKIRWKLWDSWRLPSLCTGLESSYQMGFSNKNKCRRDLSVFPSPGWTQVAVGTQALTTQAPGQVSWTPASLLRGVWVLSPRGILSIHLHDCLCFCLLFPVCFHQSPHAQSCPSLCNLMDYNLPGSSGHGSFQARILEQIAIFFSRGSSRPRDQTLVSCFGRQIPCASHHIFP